MTRQSPNANAARSGTSRRAAAAPRLTRAEKTERTRQALFDAAATVVGQLGYANASVSDITREARIAQGTFYNYFTTRQELLDELLPRLGKELLGYIRDRVSSVTGDEAREEARFRAFFDFLKERPQFYRILHEAEQFAPKAFQKHIKNMAMSYVRALDGGRRRKAIQGYNETDLEVISYILMSARDYLSMHYAYSGGRVRPLPPEVVTSYMKFIRRGLFCGHGEANGAANADEK